MNKYQEALDNIADKLIDCGRTKDLNGETILKEQSELNLLQELVDKATPKKPLVKHYEEIGEKPYISNKEELLESVNNLQNEYDAFLMMNRYSWEIDKNSHAKEFELLSKLKGEKVQNALAWIHDCYDCYYKDEIAKNENNPFNYLRGSIENA